MTRSVAQRYQQYVDEGILVPDAAQAAAASRLDELACQLSERSARTKPGLLAKLWREPASSSVRGLYVHGGVGRGKSMLMNLFYEATDFAPKRRIHFHAFMSEVHERIARGRATTDGDPIPFVAAEITGEAALLCFDELQVTDIADAMILGRLFKRLFENGVVVVATSNSAPDRLYWNGLNRDLFLPFVAMLETHLETFELASSRDFRLDKLDGRQLYFSPIDNAAQAGVDAHWQRLTVGTTPKPMVLDVNGRPLTVPLAANGVARFHFDDLCARPLGSNDYLQLVHNFHTLVIDGVAVMGPEKRNEARRFINLIDTLYDQRVCLIVTAAAEPERLYPHGDGSEAFGRTASRLTEMRSEAYLQASQLSGASGADRARF